MKGYDDEIVEFLDSIINNDKYVSEAQSFIYTSYSVSSKYDKSTSTLYIWTTNLYEDANAGAANEYLRTKFKPEILNIKYEMKGDN